MMNRDWVALPGTGSSAKFFVFQDRPVYLHFEKPFRNLFPHVWTMKTANQMTDFSVRGTFFVNELAIADELMFFV